MLNDKKFNLFFYQNSGKYQRNEKIPNSKNGEYISRKMAGIIQKMAGIIQKKGGKYS